jgi:hypothetical protein
LGDVSYLGSIENATNLEFKGSIGRKDLQEKFFEVKNGTGRIYANVSSTDGNGDIAFLILDPQDLRVYAAVGSETMGSPDISNPQPGRWRIWIYGNSVPSDHNESYSVSIHQYLRGKWDWMTTSGPARIESGSGVEINASLKIPDNASSGALEGDIGIRSANQTFTIPVSVTVVGTTLKGLNYSKVEDKDKDGYFDRLSIGFALNVTTPGNYTVEGPLLDCSGNKIDWLKGSAVLQKSGDINIDVDGEKVWKMGRCGPLVIPSLFLYNENGDILDSSNKRITIPYEPAQFQHHAAYFNGNFTNETTSGMIEIGVGVRVIKPGTYDLGGRIEDDKGDDLGDGTTTSKLAVGNSTVFLGFNPAKFIIFNKPTRIHLRDLSLKLNGTEIDNRTDAWTSDELDPGYFRSSHSAIRTDKGRVIIP